MRRTNYFSALSDHHCFSTKQFSLYGGVVWSLVFSKWQHRYFMLVFCLTVIQLFRAILSVVVLVLDHMIMLKTVK